MVNLNKDLIIRCNIGKIKKALIETGFEREETYRDNGRDAFSKIFFKLKEREICDKKYELNIECEIVFWDNNIQINYVLYGGGEVCVWKKIKNEDIEKITETDFLDIVSNDVNNLIEQFSFDFLTNLFSSIQ